MPRAAANPTRRRAKSQQPLAGGDIDAALVVAAAEHEGLETRYALLCADEERLTASEEAAIEVQETAIFARQRELRKLMQRTPAQTRTGFEAKAKVAIAWLKECRADEASLTLSLIADLTVAVA